MPTTNLVQKVIEAIKKYIYSGEFFDMNATTYNDIYGREKLLYSLIYGIALPMQKYIDEYKKIQELTHDVKTSKRDKRLAVFIACAEAGDIITPLLDIFFIQLLIKLNGDGDGDDAPHLGTEGSVQLEYEIGQYNNQDLIMIVSGGNIITIFAKLLQNIQNSKNL